ncbi:MAG: kelch repeat-containing protein [Rhodothermales bacterium]
MPQRAIRPTFILLMTLVVLFLPLRTRNGAFAQDAAGVWTNLNTTNTPIARHENAFAAVNGKLYLIGGRGVKKVQIFDTQTSTWSDGAPPPFQMHHFQAIVIGDLIYVIGAYTGACCDAEFGVDHVYYYNTANNTWNQSHAVPVDRQRGSAGAVLYNDKIYLVGGIQGGHGAPATGYTWFDEYDPVTGQWKVLPDAPRKRDHFHAVVFNNKLYLIGGRDTSNPAYTSANIGEIDIYNFTTGTWSTLSASHNLPTLRGGTTSVMYHGEILVMGGESSKQTLAFSTTEAFDPIAQTWRTLAPLNVGRHGTQAALLNDAVYIAAGSAQQGGAPELDSIERYDNGSTNVSAADVVLNPGWNMVGLPLSPSDTDYEAVFNDISISQDMAPITWSDAGDYAEEANLAIGAGYWVHLDETSGPSQVQTITGEPINALQIALKAGWNMIAGPSCTDVVLRGISTDPIAAIPTSALYTWADAYVPAYSTSFPRGRVSQGIGYWVFANENAVLTLDCGTAKQLPDEAPAAAGSLDAFHRLLVTDDTGKRQILHFGGALTVEDAAASYRLPPRANGRSFDVRLGDDTRLTENTAALVRLQSTALPFTLSFEAAAGRPAARYRVEELVAGQLVATHSLAEGERLTLDDPYVQSIRIALEPPADVLPDAPLRVAGNYPNPFSDHTAIRFDLATDARVRLAVYDALGRQRYAVERSEIAGFGYEEPIASAGWPAGLYVYRIEAETATGVSVKTGRFLLVR